MQGSRLRRGATFILVHGLLKDVEVPAGWVCQSTRPAATSGHMLMILAKPGWKVLENLQMVPFQKVCTRTLGHATCVCVRVRAACGRACVECIRACVCASLHPCVRATLHLHMHPCVHACMRACSVRAGVHACVRAGGQAIRQAGGSAVMCARDICVCV